MNYARDIANLVGELVDGFPERIEYHTRVTVHTGECKRLMERAAPGMLKHWECYCPQRIEPRAQTVTQDSLLVQLMGEASAYRQSQGGARSGRPESRPPASLDALELIRALDAYLCSLGLSESRLEVRLRNLVSHSMRNGDDWSLGVIRQLRSFIHTARIMLGYEMPKRQIRDTVCGTCGGTLVVATDASSDVTCTGTDELPPCGTVYRRWQWVELLVSSPESR